VASVRYKHSGQILAALNKLMIGEKWVMIEMPLMNYKEADTLRNRAKYYAENGKGMELHTRTIHLDDRTLLFVAVKGD
jgi:hypothetical protein